jgi:hypothetical protein
MNTYTISSHPEGPEYEVHVIGYDGIRQTMLGFVSKADAESWIAADNQRDAVRRERRMGLRWTDGGLDGWSMAST